MGVSLEVEGLTVASGTSADFTAWSGMQATVMPVVSLQDGSLTCWGSAVCVGSSGWFITAKHVIEDFLEEHGPRDDGSTGLFVLWESDEPTGGGPSNFLGAPMPVAYVHPHGSADLATLTVRVPEQAPELLRVAQLAFRMPQLGEPLAVFGYSAMSLSGQVHRDQPSTVVYERTFTVGVGQVLEQQPDRRSSGVRGCPGVVTDAPIYAGMSGGPVFDADGDVVGFASSSHGPIESDSTWNSFVALGAPALELSFMTRANDEDPLAERTLAHLVAEDAVLTSADDTFDVDAGTGRAVFRTLRTP
ncbi:MAG: serine protease [Marmoricola sp.]|nr:serine protease [Marmoricola sp.]